MKRTYKFHTMNNTFITKAILILFLTVAAVPCLAQQRGTVSFNYDANGNRILRQIEIGGGRGEAATATIGAMESHEPIEVALYPNPTEGRFSVGIANAESGERVRATVTTVTGEVLCDKTVADQTTEFDLTSQPAGIYLLRLTVRGESQVWKVIKK